VKWTVPAYPEATLPNASRAVTVAVKAAPAVAFDGAATTKCVAEDAATATDAVDPVMELVTVSVAVTVRAPADLSVTAFVNAWTPASPAVNV
jgi:hypothetical protein